MDTIADFITIIRNASSAGKEVCAASHSKMREALLKILTTAGFISGYDVLRTPCGFKTLSVRMKYDADGAPAISGIQRCSKPGCRRYFGYKKIPRVLSGLGCNILSTPKGVMTGREAVKEKLGGELLVKVW